MKRVVYLASAVLLLSFTNRDTSALDGLWKGIYRTDNVREKVVVRFDEDGAEIFAGEVTDANKYAATYELLGDTAIRFSYKNAEGNEVVMEGTFNKRMTYVDGVWQTSDKTKGNFFLRKEKMEELFIQP